MPRQERGATRARTLQAVVLESALLLLCWSQAEPNTALGQSAELPTILPDDAPPPQSQEAGPPIRFEATLNAALSVPRANNPDDVGFGFALTYGVGWGDIPITFGLDFMSVSTVGDATRTVDLQLMAGPEPAERNVSTRLLHFDAWLRLQPGHWFIRPYAEGFIGTQLFQGKYWYSAGAERSDLAQAEDWVRSWGWGAGVELNGILNQSGTWSLTLGLRDVRGATANGSRSVVIRNERVQTRYAADTSVLLFMVGIGLHYEMNNPPPSHYQFMGD